MSWYIFYKYFNAMSKEQAFVPLWEGLCYGYGV
jgi:hypothetical protein